MVNKAVGSQVATLQDQKTERAKEAEANKTKKGFPKRFFLMPNKPFYITFLHSYEKGLDLSIHNIWKIDNFGKGKYVPIICNKQYANIDPMYESCSICEERVNGRLQNPYFARVFLGYVHNFEGETFTSSRGTYEVDPIRVVEVRYGKGGANILELKEFHTKGVFQKKIFEQKKIGTGKDTTYLPMNIADPDMMGEEVSSIVPKHVLQEHSDLSEDEIAQRLLATYGNVLWDLWEVEPPKITDSISDNKEEEPEAEQAPSKKGSARKALG